MILGERSLTGAVRPVRGARQRLLDNAREYLDRTSGAASRALDHHSAGGMSSELRLATRDADLAALATLADRGYTPEERARLRALIAKATTVVPVAPLSDAQRVTILLELHGWLTDWSASAKLVITRRDHLIRLGIAKRRKSRGGNGGVSGGGGNAGSSGNPGAGGSPGGTPGGSVG